VSSHWRVFWDMTPSGLVNRFWYFGRIWGPQLHCGWWW